LLGSLFVGVIWMAGASTELGQRLNFVNFIALPVTLGIGVDYGVNILNRLRGEPRDRYRFALAETGGAVALCSLTTIISYSSMLVADSGALRSLGKVANLGEIGCLLAAWVLVPAVMALANRRTRTPHRQARPGSADDAAA